MGVSGKSRELQFFMTDDEMKTLLTHTLKENIVLINGEIFEDRNPIIIRDINEMAWPRPLNDPNWWFWNNDIGDLSLEYNNKYFPNKYKLEIAPSPIIQFSRCLQYENILQGGRIATLLSYYNDKNEEIEKPSTFIKWWKELKKNFNKGLVRCVIKTGDKEVKTTLWASRGAINLYKKGIELKQALDSPVLFHPKL